MKKLLATLLVALMIMSCMAVVSFAEGHQAYTITEFPNEAMSVFDPDEEGDFVDPLTRHYYTNMRAAYNKNHSSTITASVSRGTPIMAAIKAGKDDAAEYSYEIPATATPADVVAIPVYCSEPGVPVVSVKATWNAEYLTPVVDAEITGAAGACEIKDGAWVLSSFNTDPVAGVHFYLYFTINEDAKGDAKDATTATTQVNLNIVENSYISSANIGNEIVNVKLSGLQPGEGGGSSEPTDISADDVAAITPVVAGTFAAENMVADIQKAYGVDVSSELADVYDAANMSYVPVFATFPTTDKNAPEAYGIILKGEGMEDVKVAGKDANNGMYGVIFYGFTGHLAKYTEAYAYVTVGGVTYTSALGSIN